MCFECKKPGHFKAECPSLQRSKGKDKRKAFVSSISVNSSDEEASDEEEVANLCLVAREDDEEASSDLDLTNEDHEVTLSELQEAYNEVHEEFSRLCKAYKVLKTKKESLESKVDSLSEELAEARRLPIVDGQGSPQVEPNAPTPESCPNCSKISEENNKLQNALQKFTNGSEMLNILLMNQRAYRDRTGLGYTPRGKKWVEPKVKPYLKFFHKATSHSSSPFSFCNYCNRKGHSMSTCNAKKHGANSSYKWVPKGTKATQDLPLAKDTKEGQGSRAWNHPTGKTQEPRASTRPEDLNNHKPKVKDDSRPRALKTNDRGPKKDWVPKFA